ncbi:MAG: reverse transcriptase domain-containing protein [Defluviitaleaceae bacterium]|nr:reverse transcriptase domain-containing protein [Defluviitaleaceae bacterium]
MKILKVHVSTPFISSPTYVTSHFREVFFSSRLKFSEIKPLHKKGGRTAITNFRPISLITFFSKILRKVIYTKLYQYINKNNILAKEKYGFRNNSSTEKASFKLINEILLALNNTLRAGGIFCDLEKELAP